MPPAKVLRTKKLVDLSFCCLNLTVGGALLERALTSWLPHGGAEDVVCSCCDCAINPRSGYEARVEDGLMGIKMTLIFSKNVADRLMDSLNAFFLSPVSIGIGGRGRSPRPTGLSLFRAVTAKSITPSAWRNHHSPSNLAVCPPVLLWKVFPFNSHKATDSVSIS